VAAPATTTAAATEPAAASAPASATPKRGFWSRFFRRGGGQATSPASPNQSDQADQANPKRVR
jgi:hypothetical protein